jgi:hypothetical protein
MKKILMLAVVGTFAAGLVGCTEATPSKPSGTAKPSDAPKPGDAAKPGDKPADKPK